MTKDEILALADAYADEQRDWGNGSERTRIARAALEAALTEKQEPVGINGLTEAETAATASVMGLVATEAKQEPVAWMLPRDGDDCAVFREPQDFITPYTTNGWTPLYTHPAPVNQQLLADAQRYRWLLERIYKDGGELCTHVPNGYDNFVMDIEAAVDAAIAAAEGKV